MKTEPKRERIVREATRQFAAKGYERTTVADIQEASGLSPGAGGLYRHFPSKEAVLEEAVFRVITSFEGRAQKLGQESHGGVDAFLRMVGQAVLDDFAEERDSVRIVLRDLDQFPHLQAAFRERRLRPGFTGLSAWLQAQVKLGRLRENDCDATAVLILGSLMFVRITEALLGKPPVDVADSRLLDAWLDLVLTGLVPSQSSPPSEGE